MKVMGERQSILAPAELGQGEMNAYVKEGLGWWSGRRNAKGRRLELMSGAACDVQPNSIEKGKP
jgi:hypothetical protein